MRKNRNMTFSFFSIFFALGFFIGWLPLKMRSAAEFDLYFRTLKFSGNSSELFSLDNYISSSQYYIDILHYDLDIDLYPSQKLIKAKTIITGKILSQDLDKIELNFYDNLDIKELKLDNKFVNYLNKDTRLTIFLNETLSDTFELMVEYEGTPKRKGFSAFTFGEINGNSVVYNMNEPSYASTWFPCNDIPSDKALLDIKITNDSAKTSISNGILLGSEIIGSRKTYHWKTLYPISTYLICLYSADYIEIDDKYISHSGDSMNINYYVFPDHVEKGKIDFKNTPKMIDFFSKTFGEYPFIKEKYGIAEFLWQMGAMEHQTITGIGSNFVSGKNFFEDIYVHELAHHWWGNAVGPASWKDIWLNEGFATYSEALYSEFIGGADALKSTMLSKFSDSFSNTLYDPGKNLFSSTVYDKGAWVLHMLRWEVGDSTFFKILRTYFEKFKYSYASTEDFINVCELETRSDLSKFFDQWVYSGTENIKADYTWNIRPLSNGNYSLTLNIKQTPDNYSKFQFKLEVLFEYDEGNNFSQIVNVNQREQTFEFQLTKYPNQILLDPHNWLLASFFDRNSYEH